MQLARVNRLQLTHGRVLLRVRRRASFLRVPLRQRVLRVELSIRGHACHAEPLQAVHVGHVRAPEDFHHHLVDRKLVDIVRI
eukprot:1098614-Pyramimonas_sp.AAC.1